jgi:flagellar biosynthesis protein FlhG
MTAGSGSAAVRRRGPVSLAVTSGKGGVGKTNVVVNLAISLARLHNRVAVLDADFGLGNVDVLLGLAPASHLGHLLTGEKMIGDIIVDGPHGIRVIPAGSGMRELTALTPTHWQRLASGLSDLAGDLDFLLVDTGAGISSNVTELIFGSDRVLVVTSLDPTAVVDAYALIKIVTANDPRKEIGLVINGAESPAEADLVFDQLDVAAGRFLKRRLQSYGFIVQDPTLREAVLMQRAVVEHAPDAPASRCFRTLANRISSLAPLGGPGLRLVHREQPAKVAISGLEAPQCA